MKDSFNRLSDSCYSTLCLSICVCMSLHVCDKLMWCMYVCILNKRAACSGTRTEQNVLSQRSRQFPGEKKRRKRIERSAAYEKGRERERGEARSSITKASGGKTGEKVRQKERDDHTPLWRSQASIMFTMGRVLLNSNSQHLISPVCLRMCWIARGGPLYQTLCGKNPEIQSLADRIYKPIRQYVCPQHLFFCTRQTYSVENKEEEEMKLWNTARWSHQGFSVQVCSGNRAIFCNDFRKSLTFLLCLFDVCILCLFFSNSCEKEVLLKSVFIKYTILHAISWNLECFFDALM